MIDRRTLLKLAPIAAFSPGHLLASLEPSVKRVLVVFKCHLDVGFTQTQTAVKRKYFDEHYPAALALTQQLRATDTPYTWTTGSWLLYEYLDQATPAQRTAMEQAITHGDIAWHALPFSWQSEMLDRTMIEGALGFSRSLDARFGKRTIAAKMTDVPGHTRGLIAPLVAAGIQLLDIGVNAASTPPEVPDIFLWKNRAGQSIIMIYHRHSYGSVVHIPGSDLAISVEVRDDNMGPHTAKEVREIYASLRQQFPAAAIHPASLTDVAHAVLPYRTNLPAVTGEIGDTWIYGIPSDPTKVARYREFARLRRTWIADRKLSAGDPTDIELLRHVLLTVEHTWGTDTKSYLDTLHYQPADLPTVLDRTGYQNMTVSWQEKRDDLDHGIATLPELLRTEAQTSLASLTPDPKKSSSFGEMGGPALPGAPQPLDLTAPIHTTHFTLRLDTQTGAIVSLIPATSTLDWASPANPLCLFTYQTLSAPDFAGFLDRYIKSKADWAPRDFGKPGIERFHPQSRDFHPTLKRAGITHFNNSTQILLHLAIEDHAAEATGNVAWPANLYLEYTFLDDHPFIQIRLTTLNKQANRLPEAMWLTFLPRHLDARTCTFPKIDETILLPEVIRGGGRAMHAISGPIKIPHPAKGRPLTLTTHDAPVLAIGDRTPLNFTLDPPDIQKGLHIGLFNNAWGTNYPQWASGDWSFRFTLTA